ncbi:hypothetical protein T310_2446 [Rasamsonia emersonii CBS 393.64]|uniref:Uncharacterized protein n=1 Tax=Rasamsonia emersonii (strain ATCC 16479 / CBS 393.64 / IMI 116815) TaxID=1408163 RepID=A0A0F4YZ45_RASE3|nr:hypothetical protein T310_2446 [Rasamsonia emersonii CBS 393.64]KKA23519.1 hypothetical protein T310_2446 [Rasamsonia emersonii CBS 393.64]
MLIHVKSLADHHSPDLNFKLSQSEMDYLTTYLPGQDVQCLRHARAMTRSRANRRGRPPTRLRRPGEDLQSCIFCISIKVDKVDREFSIKLRMVVGRDDQLPDERLMCNDGRHAAQPSWNCNAEDYYTESPPTSTVTVAFWRRANSRREIKLLWLFGSPSQDPPGFPVIQSRPPANAVTLNQKNLSSAACSVQREFRLIPSGPVIDMNLQNGKKCERQNIPNRIQMLEMRQTGVATKKILAELNRRHQTPNQEADVTASILAPDWQLHRMPGSAEYNTVGTHHMAAFPSHPAGS